MRDWPWPSSSGLVVTGMRHTRTTACCAGQAAFGTRITSLSFQPLASLGCALSYSTKRARGWHCSLVRTTANLYGCAASPVNTPSSRAQASGIWRSVCAAPTACGVPAARCSSGVSAAKEDTAGNKASHNR